MEIFLCVAESAGCQTFCRVDAIGQISQQTKMITCYNKEGEKLEGVTRIPAGGYCEVSCTDKPGKV